MGLEGSRREIDVFGKRRRLDVDGSRGESEISTIAGGKNSEDPVGIGDRRSWCPSVHPRAEVSVRELGRKLLQSKHRQTDLTYDSDGEVYSRYSDAR